MKYLAVVGLMFFSLVVFAQDGTSHIELQNQGNDALRENNFAEALELYEAALAAWPEDEEINSAMIFNMATCARRSDNHEKALEYYQKSVDLGYRADFSTFYVATALNNLERHDEMEEVLLQAMTDFRSSSVFGHMRRLLTNYYLRQGAEPYNRASQILASAQDADPSEFDAITARANVEFEKAKPWFEKVLEIDPDNSNAQASLREINTRLN
ncbi:tetratricopeptide repeat protein [Natronoflexus pectinivorans]|uniref:Tetratricopeptide repeat protein n=1 Tax=Natronoflexus pectinivorans TaxID=682526 RepID=A0A4R2GK83_9BACT|nr:tetratricopeptide repeat protein [Natronoflexus pectinivorans]TCO09251.1 tetratricopeptide repeat protein [Natronoflexus pectinivorans]